VLAEAIARYHDLLTPEVAAVCQDRLLELQGRKGLGFGDRHLSTVLRPRFLTFENYRWIRQRVALLMQAFSIIHQAALANPLFRQQFRLTPEEDELFQLDPGFHCPMPTSRLDAFFVPDQGQQGLRFTEFNAETPAAPAYTDELADVFLALPIMGQFARDYHVVAPPARPAVLHALLESYVEWRGVRELPRIAIVDWLEVPTYSEFVLFHDYFSRLGIQVRIGDVRECEFRNGQFTVGGQPVDLVYKRVLISELIEKAGMNHPLIQAVRAGAVCMVNPFRCKALYKKASFAVLSDETNASLFTPSQHQAIHQHIPWTRLVEPRRTVHNHQSIDLIEFIIRNKEKLALKPNDDYGGKGIVLGWTVDQHHWEQAVQTAQTTPYVVQERIPLPSEPFPTWVHNQLQITDRLLDTAPFVSMGNHVEGCLTRIATDPLLNVTAGGGSTVPTFLVEPRS
jgi:hypothetical protein